MMRGLGALLTALALSVPAQAEPPSAQAQFDLGRRYRNGIGVERDVVRGHCLILSAARREHAPAMFILSNMLAEGEGAARDLAQARLWLESAAAREYPEALVQLALNLREGTMGFARDDARSAQLMREAAHALKHRAQKDAHEHANEHANKHANKHAPQAEGRVQAASVAGCEAAWNSARSRP